MARKTIQTTAPPSIAPTLTPERAKARFQKLLEQTAELLKDGKESPGFATWRQDVQVALAQYFGRPSLQLEQFEQISFSPLMLWGGMPDSEFVERRRSGLRNSEGLLKSRIKEIDEDLAYRDAPFPISHPSVAKNTSKVFLVHGHDHGFKETAARFLEQLELEPIILHEKSNEGRTIIEKFEHYADVACALVILTPDDVGRAKSVDVDEPRARQNVIFEMGFFVGKLGRKHTLILLHPEIAIPSDVDGLLYTSMKDDAWRMKLVGELKAIGLKVDANKAF